MDATEQNQTRVPMSRPGYGTKGRNISVVTNHFNVRFGNTSEYFFQYSVSVYYEDGKPVEMKGIGRKVMDKVHETYSSLMGDKVFAYDGEKALFTVGSLPNTELNCTVVLEKISSERTDDRSIASGSRSPSEEERKRRKRISHSKKFHVEIRFATKIPMKAIVDAIRGKESDEYFEGIRVLDIVLRQHAAKQGCLLLRQSFFHDDNNYKDIGRGIRAYKGFHSSFRATENGLSLNMDLSNTTIVQPGSIIEFLIENQYVKDKKKIDWKKAERTMKNLRIEVAPDKTEWKIRGLSDEKCGKQKFLLKRRTDGGDIKEIEITVYDYFVKHRNISLKYSGEFPCINVGKPNRPTYIPVELCSLLPLQRYTKALTVHQRSDMVNMSRQKPDDKMRILKDAIRKSKYADDPVLRACGITISGEFMRVEGRVLDTPMLRFGDKEEIPRNGSWNVNCKRLAETHSFRNWVLVNFSPGFDPQHLVRSLVNAGRRKGHNIDPPMGTYDEDPQHIRASPRDRVNEMVKQLKPHLKGHPRDRPNLIICILPVKKNSELYGPWKMKALTELGIVTQCLAPQRVNDQYISNVLLKINAKLGGVNHQLAEVWRNVPVYMSKPTIIFGMDVFHSSPGQSEVPSIAAVVSSRSWPSIYHYRASVRSQSPKVEMIDSLYKPEDQGRGIICELLDDFYESSGRVLPSQIIILRDGVGESQFKQVLNIEYEQILQACNAYDKDWFPKFTIIVAQKNQHTKFFQRRGSDNVPPGTVIDTNVCHPLYYDFYMCAQAGRIGTSRPTHYHVLLDDIGFSPDDLQEFIHSLSYVYQRSTTAISIAAPIRYAHLAASLASQFPKYDDMSETTSGHESMTSVGSPPVPKLPKLHKDVCTSMFFC